MRIWLKGHGYQPEPTQPTTQRTFDYGDCIEWLMFNGLTIPSHHDDSGFKEAGNWWKKTDVLTDPKTGQFFRPPDIEIVDRQLEVNVGPFKGHIDGWGLITLLTGDPDTEEKDAAPTLTDVKSANGWSFDRAKYEPFEDITPFEDVQQMKHNVFSREYVITQNGYMAGLQERGINTQRGALVYVNKEIGQIMFRLLRFRPELVEEGKERLSWANSEAEPKPDWDWKKGSDIPLRCGYCEQKINCGQVRGLPLTGPTFDKKGKPTWRPA